MSFNSLDSILGVSTHSRPKAAGTVLTNCHLLQSVSTHSRPKAAGCLHSLNRRSQIVSTHSRPKAAGPLPFAGILVPLGFNTQPPEGGWNVRSCIGAPAKRFNTQPPEGGWSGRGNPCLTHRCFNTQPPEGGWRLYQSVHTIQLRFQHTAARRRLVSLWVYLELQLDVSTHSRPKAAGEILTDFIPVETSFNTQPPEGGWA